MKKISRRNFLKGALAVGVMPLAVSASSETKQDKLKFIHVTDSHMDLGDSSSVDAMELMVEFINKDYQDLDFVLFGGDNFNNNASKNADALKFKEIIDKLHCPAYTVRGNKESSPKPKGDSINLQEFKDMFLSDKALNVGTKDWSLDMKGYQILGLDSCIENQNNGLYTKETIEFAKKKLQTSKPTIILNHHPYTNYWKGTQEADLHKYVLNNTKKVQEELFGFDNLILTLSGHKHIDSVKKLNHTTMIVTRGFVRPLDLDMYPMRYVEIENSKISEKLIYTS